jgi:hypothetical protein
MAIIRPITESQVEISLYRDDGQMNYPGLFVSSSEVRVSLEGGRAAHHPIVIRSAFDPDHYKDLLNYCTDYLGTEKRQEDSFTLEFRIHRCGGSREVWGQYQVLGCKLIGYSLPKFNRESGKVAEFDLTFLPSNVTNILT